MNKSIAFVFFLIITFVSASAFAAITVRYYNKDSKNYTFDAKCSGSSYKVSFKSSTTGSSSIQGSGPCVVKAKNTVTLKQGDKIEIKDGKITVK